jgi:hypothetical protein
VLELDVAATLVGTPGTVEGTVGSLGDEATLLPLIFRAVTVNVYEVPFTRPVIVNGEEPPVIYDPPGLAVTV